MTKIINNVVSGIAAAIAILTSFNGIIPPLFAVLMLFFIAFWIIYNHIPWPHRKWQGLQCSETTAKFQAMSAIMHKGIIIVIFSIPTVAIILGVFIRVGPTVVAEEAAQNIAAQASWNSTVIEITNVPNELKNTSKPPVPYALVVKDKGMVAASLSDTLGTIANSYGNSYFFNLGLGCFAFISLASVVLYPTELVAEAMREKESTES